MKSKIAYRIFDEKNGEPHTLFHGVNGSRKLPTDKWLEAKVGPVTDGSGVTTYQSGFHVLTDKSKAEEVFRTFFRLSNRAISKVRVYDTWIKEHSRHKVTLARFMKITKKDWQNRIKL
jgi:hypothetical protein